MKLISFDIGIKNMAYCILSLDSSANSLIIQDWGVLNLMDEPLADVYCSCLKQSIKKASKRAPTPAVVVDSPCGKRAKYQKGGVFYCEKHAKMTDYLLPKAQFSSAALNKLKVADLVKLCNTYHIMDLGEGERIPVKRVILEKMVDYFRQTCLDPIIPKQVKSAADTDLITIGRNMKTKLDDVLAKSGILGELTHVIMENQISPIATRMKTIQGMLAQYFIQNETVDRQYYLEFISSSNKLKLFEGAARTQSCNIPPLVDSILVDPILVDPILENVVIETDNIKTPKSTNNYEKNKKSGVYYTSLLLDKNQDWRSWKSALLCKKKDDLADCFLQGIWYMKRLDQIDLLPDYIIALRKT